MKKLIIFFILILCLSLTAAAEFVFDAERLMSLEECESLESALSEISKETGYDVVAVTSHSFDNKSARDYADDFYDYGGFGEDGILLLISASRREWYISTSGDAVYTYGDSALEYFETELLPYLSDGDFYGAFERFGELCRDEYSSPSHTSNESYYSPNTDTDYAETREFSASRVTVPVIFGLIVGLISVSVMKSQLKSVKSKTNAGDYVKSGSLNITTSSDRFLWRKVNRQRRQTDSSGTRTGGSVHRSSSGRSHGGRGGRF